MANLWNVSFAETGILSPEFLLLNLGTGVSYAQSGGNLVVTAGTTANKEFLARSNRTWKHEISMRHSMVASQRIANNNFMVMLADLIGENLGYNCTSAVSVTVEKIAHGYTDQNVGQFMFLGAITEGFGIPGRYAIASIPDADHITFTVAGWSVGQGELCLFGHNFVRTLYTGTTATTAHVEAQRKGWAAGETAITTNTSASSGHILQTKLTGREVFWYDALRASTNSVVLTSRGSRLDNILEQSIPLHIFLWNFNGTVNPATSTTWTIGMISVQETEHQGVCIEGVELQGTHSPLPVHATNQVTVASVNGTGRIGTVSTNGFWYDDSSTPLAAGATFTGTSRDLTVTASATAWTGVTVTTQEYVTSAESDQVGTLWIEASRDNTNWQRVKSVATAAVAGGGQYAEIVHRPSWRYCRSGFTNGATLQTRFTIGTFMKGA